MFGLVGVYLFMQSAYDAAAVVVIACQPASQSCTTGQATGTRFGLEFIYYIVDKLGV